jgi:hypothetical protein
VIVLASLAFFCRRRQRLFAPRARTSDMIFVALTPLRYNPNKLSRELTRQRLRLNSFFN